MSKDRSQEHFKELTAAFIAGRISRRHFIHQAARLGISAALLSRILPQAYRGRREPGRLRAGGTQRIADHEGADRIPEKETLQRDYYQRAGIKGDCRRRP